MKRELTIKCPKSKSRKEISAKNRNVMKKLLLLTSIFLVAGCGEHKKPEARLGVGNSKIFVETVRGHDYVIFDGYYKGGIVHAESCPCKQNKK